jgi:transcriptional regulator with XRE-family HTH domain
MAKLENNRRECQMQTLADYLVANKISQKDFAAALGVDKSIVSKLCSGKIRPGLDIGFRIKRLTGGKVPFEVWIEDHDLPTDPAFWVRFFDQVGEPPQISWLFGCEIEVAEKWIAGKDIPTGLDALRAFAFRPEAFAAQTELAA